MLFVLQSLDPPPTVVDRRFRTNSGVEFLTLRFRIFAVVVISLASWTIQAKVCAPTVFPECSPALFAARLSAGRVEEPVAPRGPAERFVGLGYRLTPSGDTRLF